MKVLITGAQGQIGFSLIQAFDKPSYTIYTFSKKDLDITDFSKSQSIIREIQPDIIVNAASYTQVDACEKNVGLAFQINTIGVHNVTRICREYDITLAQFSTDYVFDGAQSSPYQEDDSPAPLNIYGISKLAGENLIKA